MGTRASRLSSGSTTTLPPTVSTRSELWHEVWSAERELVRLVVYTDNVGWGGADLSMSHLVSLLDPAIEVTVVGVVPSDHRAGRRRSSRGGHAPRSAAEERSRLAEPTGACRDDPSRRSRHRPREPREPMVVPVLHRRGDHRPPASRRRRLPARRPADQRSAAAGETSDRARRRPTRRGRRKDVPRCGERSSVSPTGSLRTIHNGVPDAPHRRAAAPAARAAHRRDRPARAPEGLRHAGPGARPRWTTPHSFSSAMEVNARALERLARSVGVADRVFWPGWSDDAARLPLDVRRLRASVALRRFSARGSGGTARAIRRRRRRRRERSEAVIHGETGLLVPPEDPAALARAIRRLLADPGLRQHSASGGASSFSRRFTAAHMTRAFESLYAELLSRR